MDKETLELAKTLVSANYIALAEQSLRNRENMIKTLLSQRRMPDEGWDDLTIQAFLAQLAQMDSNNFNGNVGIGEREGRVYSSLVAQRHYMLSHGIGRSGDLTENQPKAAGSSLLYALTNALALNALKIAGAKNAKKCIVVPMATGMTLALTLRALYSTTTSNKQQQQQQQQQPAAAADDNNNNNNKTETAAAAAAAAATATATATTSRRRYVLFCRIDQKSCLKCISTAGFEAVVVENKLEGDFLTTDLDALERHIQRLGAENVLCVLSTTSCFAPRLPDRVIEIAKLCSKYNIGHVINNAYGVQSRKIMNHINTACSAGRVDAFVQSTDKNFMVPVGGAIVAGGPKAEFIDKIAQTYAGRASISPILDLFITLLSMGANKFSALLKEREELMSYFVGQMETLAAKYKQRLLVSPKNEISFAMTVDGLAFSSPKATDDNNNKEVDKKKKQQTLDLPMLGSLLFYRAVSGPRVVAQTNSSKNVVGIDFLNYGSHYNHYPHSYLTQACAIGITKEDIQVYLARLEKVLATNTKTTTTTTND